MLTLSLPSLVLALWRQASGMVVYVQPISNPFWTHLPWFTQRCGLCCTEKKKTSKSSLLWHFPSNHSSYQDDRNSVLLQKHWRPLKKNNTRLVHVELWSVLHWKKNPAKLACCDISLQITAANRTTEIVYCYGNIDDLKTKIPDWFTLSCGLCCTGGRGSKTSLLWHYIFLSNHSSDSAVLTSNRTTEVVYFYKNIGDCK